MKVCGFSFVRDGVKLDYPFIEAIRSILPICDEVVVAVGKSADDTLDKLRSIDPKVTILETEWDERLQQGRVLAAETDKAFQAIPAKYDWAFYIQGDEVIHEQYLPVIRQAMEKNLHNKKVDGLLLKYRHFFGSYDYVGAKYSWYRREIRVVRNNKNIFSFRDAQGFRKKPNEKLRVKLIDAYVFHYGWVRHPSALKEKEKVKIRLYRKDDTTLDWYEDHMEHYTYERASEPVQLFTGTHPAVMHERIARQNWPYQPDLSIRYFSRKDRFKRIIGRWTGWYPGEYKNYRII